MHLPNINIKQYFSSREVTAESLEHIARWLVLMGACVYFISWGHALREIAWWGPPVLIILSRTIKGSFPLPRLTTVNILLLAFILLCIAGAINQPYFLQTYKTWKHIYLKTFLIAFSIACLFRKEENLKKLIIALITGCTILVITVTYQNIFDYILTKTWQSLRASSTYYQYMRSLPFALAIFLFLSKSLNSKPLYLILLTLGFTVYINVIFMNSRGMLIITSLTIVAWIFLHFKSKKTQLLTLFSFLTALYLILIALGTDNRLVSLNVESPRYTLHQDYITILGNEIPLLQLFLGHGVNHDKILAIYTEYLKQQPSSYPKYCEGPHNAYIETILYQGIFGLILILGIFSLCIHNSFVYIKKYSFQKKSSYDLKHHIASFILVTLIASNIILGLSENFDIMTLGIYTGLSSALNK